MMRDRVFFVRFPTPNSGSKVMVPKYDEERRRGEINRKIFWRDPHATPPLPRGASAAAAAAARCRQ